MKKTHNFWLGLLLGGIVISVPEGTLIRIASDSISISVLTMLRYAVAAAFALPFVLTSLKKGQVSIQRLLRMMLIAIPLSLDPLIAQYVIATTSASFQAILTMFTPIVFVIASTLVTKDKISRNKIIGFLIAVLGGMVMVVLPNLGNEVALSFGTAPVLLMLVQAICVSVLIIVWRRENERGTPLIVILGTFYFVWTIVATILALLSGEIGEVRQLSANNLLLVIYLGVVASIIYNAVLTGFYRRVGTTNAATMKYFKQSLTIILPIIVLGETLTWQIALGALLIFAGTVVAHKHVVKIKKKRSR